MKVYIAGKITGNENYKKEFRKAEEVLNKLGHIVMNPAVLNLGFKQMEYLHICLLVVFLLVCQVL